MKIAAIFHVPFEKLGMIEDWIIQKGHQLTEFHLYNDPRLPLIEEFDMLILMGGSMSVNDESSFPWLASEKVLITRCRERSKPVLGICLGAQLIASSLGCRVFPGLHTEIGWFPVEFKPDKPLKQLFKEFPSGATVFHWHGETFDLPAEAISLGSSAATPVQGFISDRYLVGVQFHPEVKPENISLMINHAGDELVASTYVEDAAGLAAGLIHMPENKLILDIFLNYLENLVNPSTAYGKH